MVCAVPELLGHGVGALVALGRQAHEARPREVQHARALPVHQLVVGQELRRGSPAETDGGTPGELGEQDASVRYTMGVEPIYCCRKPRDTGFL